MSSFSYVHNETRKEGPEFFKRFLKKMLCKKMVLKNMKLLVFSSDYSQEQKREENINGSRKSVLQKDIF